MPNNFLLRLLPYQYRRWVFAALILLAVAAHFFNRQVPTQPTAATLLKVNDGDTVEVAGYGRCRIIGIDTPEIWCLVGDKWQASENPDPRGVAAAKWLEQYLNQEVVIATRGRDKYGRWLIELKLPDGLDAATHIRQQGWDKLTNKR